MLANYILRYDLENLNTLGVLFFCGLFSATWNMDHSEALKVDLVEKISSHQAVSYFRKFYVSK